MKKNLIRITTLLVLISLILSSSVFAEFKSSGESLGKKIAEIKCNVQYASGKIVTDIETQYRPSPIVYPQYQDGSKDEGMIYGRVEDLYYSDYGVHQILAVAYYDENDVLGPWISIENSKYKEFAGVIPKSVKLNNFASSNVYDSKDSTVYDVVRDDNGNIISKTEHVFETPSQEPATWAVDGISALKARNIIKEEMFKNYGYNISRQDFAYLSVVLYEQLSGKASPNIYSADKIVFNDTQDTDVLRANKLGVVNGYGNGKFGPTDSVTREQIDIMLIKAMEEAGVELDKTNITSIVFKDHNKVSSWALESVQVAYKNKIMNGVAELTIAPKNNTTREQALVLINNILSSDFDK